MKQNKYDDNTFFNKYSEMNRSKKGLEAAGEWHVFRNMLPNFQGKRVLDLGCGFGWHCRYAIENGATSVVGTDISEKMLERARAETQSEVVQYICSPIEDLSFPANTFDIVLSSLAFHYIASFEEICRKVYACLASGGTFVFSVEHPVFTAEGSQNWHRDSQQNILHWPVDNYFHEGVREATFLGEPVMKYHKTLTTYVNGLLKNGFQIQELIEPEPSRELLQAVPAMADELRRPMMLLIKAQKV